MSPYRAKRFTCTNVLLYDCKYLQLGTCYHMLMYVAVVCPILGFVFYLIFLLFEKE